MSAGTGHVSRSISDLPGPPRLPLLGNLHQMGLHNGHAVAEKWNERHGPIFQFKVGPRRIVTISDQDEINAIPRDRPHGFRRWREFESAFAEIGFPGVFSVEGEAWRRQRRLAVTALNSNRLHSNFHIIRTAAERLRLRLLEAARNGQAIDIQQELTSYAVDITSALAFGHDLNTLERRDNELQRHIQRAFNMLGRRVLFPIPYWRWIQLPADRALKRSLVELRRAVVAFIEQARAELRERPELLQAPENFLQAMLAAQQTEDGFTDEEIIGNTFALLIAGEDTTAHSMAWTIWFLAQNPRIQARWSAEADAVLGEQLWPNEYETVSGFLYGEAVLRESMRLKPVAVTLNVEPLADTTICNTRIAAGTRLLLLTRQVGLDAGGAAYDPARWLDDGHDTSPDQKSFLGFGAGPRFCPGRNLAFLESKTAMAMIARNFELELDSTGGPVTERFTFTTIPKGLRVRLRERAPLESMPVETVQVGANGNS
ncbi:MAG TPA: cytochrome P450 [Solirubrobacteraceae bacterium]